MKKIVFVVSSKNTKEQILSTWEKHGQQYADIAGMSNDDFEIFVDTGVYPDDFINKKYDTDAIVSRGAISIGLKKTNIDIPIIEIPISSSDILYAVNESRKKYGNLKIGIVGTKNMMDAVEHILDKKKLNIESYEYHTNVLEVIESNVSRAVLDGSKIILCGVRTLQYCNENNIFAGHIDTSIESIWQAITEAKRSATIYHDQRRKALQFEAILDYAQEGIFAIDNLGKFSIVNEKAAQLLDIDRASSIGKDFKTVLPKCRLKEFLDSNNEYTNHLVDDDIHKISLTKKKLIFDKKVIGSVSTFQDVTSILDAESRVRAKIYKRGHIAKHNFENIIGESQSIKEAIKKGKIYSKTSSNVLLHGNTGTGKELFAQSIHNESVRSSGPFVAVNCAALPENLLESELFGYVEGAFTGAAKGGKLGLFELAHKGTIFLDEICEMPIALQSRLLRAIQEREIMRLGDDRVIPIDVRIICATNKSLLDLVGSGKFREDLYYRLNVLCITIPPLSERGSDVLLIMRHYMGAYAKSSKTKPISILKEAEDIILRYEWKGNVRELRNICERLIALDTTGKINKSDIRNALPAETVLLETKKDSKTQERNHFPSDKRDFERSQIISALNESRFNKTEAAKLLGISYSTLWRKMNDLNIT